jgi:hypothetical protein
MILPKSASSKEYGGPFSGNENAGFKCAVWLLT